MKKPAAMPSGAGCYLIYCKARSRFYVGQTDSLSKRIQSHISNLQKGKHSVEEMQKDYNKYGDQQFFVEVFFVDSLIKSKFYHAANDVFSGYQSELIAEREAEVERKAGPDGFYWIETAVEEGPPIRVKIDGRGQIRTLKKHPHKLGLPIRVSQKSVHAVEMIAIHSTPNSALYNKDLMNSEHQAVIASRLSQHPVFTRFADPLGSSFLSFRFDRVPSLSLKKVAEALSLIKKYNLLNEKVCLYQASIGIPDDEQGLGF